MKKYQFLKVENKNILKQLMEKITNAMPYIIQLEMADLI